MKKLLIFLAACVIPLMGIAQSLSMWNNLGIDSVYVDGDNDEYLNIILDTDKLWRIIRPFGQEPPTFPFVADYYISPTGNDVTGDGSFENPWFTLEKFWTVAASTDTLYCREGTYEWTERQDLTGVSGSSGAGNMVYVFNYPGEQPVFTKSGTFGSSDHTALIAFVGDYCYFKGLEIKDVTQENGYIWWGFRALTSNNCIFQDLNIHDCGGGFHLRGDSDGNLLLNSDFHHNSDPLTDPAYDNADGLQVGYQIAGNSNTVRGCRTWSNSDDGMDMWENEGDMDIDSCWSWHNGWIPYTWTFSSSGIGFKMGGDTQTETGMLRTVTNCVAFHNSMAGFSRNGADCDMTFYNNFVYLNGRSGGWGGGFEFNGNTEPYIVRNNLAYANVPDDEDFSVYTNIDNNSWDDATVTDADFVDIDDTLSLDDPRQTGGWLPDIDFVKIASGSDLIDEGVDVSLPYNGVAPDISAHETDYAIHWFWVLWWIIIYVRNRKRFTCKRK